MAYGFELKTEGLPADYNEAINIIYGLYRERNQQIRLIDAVADKKSTVKMKVGVSADSMLRLDNSCY